MRQALAAMILGPALLIASLTWSAFALLNTVLDPDRSVRVADVLLEDEAVRAEIAASIGAGVRRSLPAEVSLQVSDEQFEAGAALALENPVVESLIRDALVQSHQAFLGEAEPPRNLDIGAAAGAVREGIVATVPTLDGAIPDTPELVIDLPTDNIPNVGFLRRWLQRFVPIGVALGAAGIFIAMIATNNRPKILRRAGYWAISAALFWIGLVFGIPWVFEQYFTGQAAIAKALVEAFFGEMRVPSLTLAGVGVGAISVAFLWRLSVNREPRPAAPEPAAAAPGGRRSADGQRERRTTDAPRERRTRSQPPAPVPQAAPIHVPVQHQPVQHQPVQHQPVQQPPVQAPPAVPLVAPAPPLPAAAPLQQPPARSEPPAAVAPNPANSRWVEGVGYVEIAPPPPVRRAAPPAAPAAGPPDAPNPDPVDGSTPRWKPDVGYVDE